MSNVDTLSLTQILDASSDYLPITPTPAQTRAAKVKIPKIQVILKDMDNLTLETINIETSWKCKKGKMTAALKNTEQAITRKMKAIEEKRDSWGKIPNFCNLYFRWY